MTDRTNRSPQRSATRAVYVISVAAELAGMHPQTLRIYERRGLVNPARTGGGNRRYSDHDIAVLRRISELAAEGMNLEGIRRVMSSRVGELSACVRSWNRPARSPSTRSPLPSARRAVAISFRCARPSPCSVSARRSSTATADRASSAGDPSVPATRRRQAAMRRPAPGRADRPRFVVRRHRRHPLDRPRALGRGRLDRRQRSCRSGGADPPAPPRRSPRRAQRTDVAATGCRATGTTDGRCPPGRSGSSERVRSAGPTPTRRSVGCGPRGRPRR